MIRRSICSYLQSNYGDEAWSKIMLDAELRQSDLLHLDSRPHHARRLVAAAARHLNLTPAELLEDLGAWLVRLDPIRRLLRFSGANFEDFVLSLEELPGRARMVLPSLPKVELQVTPHGDGRFEIATLHLPSGWIKAMAGAIRGMADDYGTLTIISVSGRQITLWIASAEHGTKRAFSLALVPEDGGDG